MHLITLFATALALTAVEPSGPADAWRYVVPAAGDPFEHPPLRAVAFGRERPDDVVEKVAYRGSRRRYAQLRYGSPSAVRVTVVIDETAAGRADLYVDADRNRRIEPRDLVAPGPDGRSWRTALDVEIVEGESTRHEKRAAVFRLGRTGLTFSHAAAGYLEGTVRIAGKAHAARRLDGDGNGRFTDPQDILWLDLNDDGRWDPVDEQFPYSNILTLAGVRYAVRSDEFGRRLSLDVLEGTGTVRLAWNKPDAAVSELSATLIGRDGSAIGLTGAGVEATAPVGEYRLGTVTLSLEDPSGGTRWTYVFSDIGRRGNAVWHKVAKGATVHIDPVGTPDLVVSHDGTRPSRPGDVLRVQPALYTSEGLLIVTVFRGSPTTPGSDDGPAAVIALAGQGGRAMESARSGFA